MQLIAGVDEAGRGPWAGPVMAAAVILNENKLIDGLKDSKKLTAKKRDYLFYVIQEKAFAWAIASASVEEIEELNILRATLLAMERAVKALTCLPDLVLVDGNQMPMLPCKGKTIIRGDSIEPAISAASILAKVARDNEMLRLDAMYPQYGFKDHKGYGTQVHQLALTKWGACEIHRRGFAPVKAVMNIGE